MERANNFDELNFFAEVKKRPNILFGQPSLLSLRDQIGGMDYAFSICNYNNQFKYFYLFTDWYHKNLTDKDGYACWWNHILYISGNDDAMAFQSFFRIFEQYLKDVHNVCLPEV